MNHKRSIDFGSTYLCFPIYIYIYIQYIEKIYYKTFFFPLVVRHIWNFIRRNGRKFYFCHIDSHGNTMRTKRMFIVSDSGKCGSARSEKSISKQMDKNRQVLVTSMILFWRCTIGLRKKPIMLCHINTSQY